MLKWRSLPCLPRRVLMTECTGAQKDLGMLPAHPRCSINVGVGTE